MQHQAAAILYVTIDYDKDYHKFTNQAQSEQYAYKSYPLLTNNTKASGSSPFLLMIETPQSFSRLHMISISQH